MGYRFHVLGLPHTASSKDYSGCAFTQKVVNFCAMMKARGHHVTHYGNELSKVSCDEHVTVTNADDISPPTLSGKYDETDETYRKFARNAVIEIQKRKQPRDFLICMWATHKTISDQHQDMIHVEAGIGYPRAHFAKFKVFESYAMLHAYRGLDAVATANGNGWWYDVVIPNYYDLEDFTFSETPGHYLAFLGMRSIGADGKGITIAFEVSQVSSRVLVVAGAGTMEVKPSHVDYVGFLGPAERRKLLSGARALLAPSLFVEPFCGASVEAMLSGTPVICSDWGAFAENVIHGVTGFRCRTFEQFIWAVDNVGKLSRKTCHDWASRNFSLDRVGEMYDEYFWSVMNIYTGNGWYEPNPGRRDLDWLARHFPAVTDGGEDDSDQDQRLQARKDDVLGD